jgi:hypothetical protein
MVFAAGDLEERVDVDDLTAMSSLKWSVKFRALALEHVEVGDIRDTAEGDESIVRIII